MRELYLCVLCESVILGHINLYCKHFYLVSSRLENGYLPLCTEASQSISLGIETHHDYKLDEEVNPIHPIAPV